MLVARVLVDGHQLATSQWSVSGATVTVLTSLRTGAVVKISYRVAGATKQVLVSATAGGTYTDGIDLVFDSANWNVAQTVWVKAIDDSVVNGDGVKVFAPAARTTTGIQGPLFIEGGVDPHPTGAVIPPAVVFVGETDPDMFTPPFNPNENALEPEQVDVVSVLNTDSVADSTGVVTDTRITGLGMGPDRTIGGVVYGGGITYSDIELLRLDLGRGNDRLLVDTTHGNVTLVNAGPGNDQIFVRNVAGPTTINGEDGNDTISVGTAFDASLFGALIDHVNAAPGGTIDRIRALLRVDGGAGADTLNVDDSGDVTADVAILTGSTLDGIDLATTPVWTYTIAHADGGTYTLSFGSATTAPIAYAATAADVKQAILALHLANVADVVVNRADDTFTVGFLGGEAMAVPALTADASQLEADNSGLDPAIAVAADAQSLTQVVDVNAASGTFTVTVGGGLATFQFAVGASADAFRDALIAAINSDPGHPVSGEGWDVGVKDVLVDRVGGAYLVTYLGLLRGTARRALRPDRAGRTRPPPAPT